MTERVSVESLRYVLTVAETGSFSAAARAYGVTQPALSNGVAKLEERLGERLFERSPRGVTQTAFGVHIIPLIERALTALDGIEAAASRWKSAGDEVIRMGVSPLIDPKLVAGAYTAVCCLSALPGPRHLVLREANMAELQQALGAGELDFILIPSVAPMPRLEHRIIASEPMVVVESVVGGERPIMLDELADKQLILMPDTCGLTAFTRDLFRSRGLTERTYAGEAVSYRVLEEWSNLGLGSAVIPRSKLAGPNTRYRPLMDDGMEVEIFYEAVWDPHSPIAADLEVLADRMAEQP
ncbi:LysR family transcriptional regulator [Nocardia sp. NPDC051787]|uniref:LysR family transcriptional regulator n=1 Tax=Nocardia sp. NPDC051787 TaxID=3155415 RepID=UPI00341F2C9A